MKFLAIITGGRAGSDFFLSLLDGHSQIMQFPGVFLFDDFYEQVKNEKNSKIIAQSFIKFVPLFFNSNKNFVERHNMLGENKNEYFEVDEDLFIKNFTEVVDGYISLASPDGGACVFYDKGCSIYSVRPSQCSSYPFWKDILKTDRRWAAESKTCRGIGQGKNWTKKEIEHQINSRVINLMQVEKVQDERDGKSPGRSF